MMTGSAGQAEGPMLRERQSNFLKFNSFCPALVNDVISNYIIQMGHFNYSPH
jgi:hypothetical protein